MAAMSTPRAEKVRPSWGWFVLGGGLLVAAVASGIGLFVWTLSGFLDTDGRVPLDGEAHVVEIDHDDDLLLWAEVGTGRPTCEVRDTTTDELLDQRSPGAQVDRQDGSGSWQGYAVVGGGAARVTVTCAGDPTPSMPATAIEVGPQPSLGGFGLGLAAAILVPLLLGGLGLVVLLVTGLLWSSRSATRR
jgi:hypothetical protein